MAKTKEARQLHSLEPRTYGIHSSLAPECTMDRRTSVLINGCFCGLLPPASLGFPPGLPRASPERPPAPLGHPCGLSGAAGQGFLTLGSPQQRPRSGCGHTALSLSAWENMRQLLGVSPGPPAEVPAAFFEPPPGLSGIVCHCFARSGGCAVTASDPQPPSGPLRALPRIR